MSSVDTTKHLNAYDIIAVVVYFVVVLFVGLMSMCRSNRGTVSGYFLAGRFMTWLPVGASLFASNIGSEHFIGLAGSGAAGGIGVGAFELNACLVIQLLGWIFLPVFIASKVNTLPEYMSKRFGGERIRIYLAVLSLTLYIFTKISVNIYSGSIFITQALGWSVYVSISLLLLLTAICTVTGGLAAVIYTDTLQFFIMIAGASYVAAKSYEAVGGFDALVYKYMRAIPSTLIPNNTECGIPQKTSWTILHDPSPSSAIPWPGFIFGQTPASIWYWCADQMMVQRVLAAKSLSHAQGATLLAGYVKILPLFIMVIPGMVSRVLYTDRVACVDPDICESVCGNRFGCSNIAYPELVLGLMPVGMRGVMMAVMLAALMSDLTSIFNSSSTLFTLDIWPMIRKNANVRELLLVGRVFCVVIIALSILWIPVIEELQGAQLFIYIQVISAYLAPPIASIYLFAILWKRLNEKGAFWGLIIGLIIGVIRMILDFTYRAPPCGQPDLRPSIVSQVHYMYFALILFWITIAIAAVISLLTDPPKPFQISRKTFWTRFDEEIESNEIELQLDNIAEHGECDETSSTNQEQQQNKPISKVKKAYDWFCGFDTSTAESRKKAAEQMNKISDINQTKRVKMILNANLVIIILVAMFIFGYFSAGYPLE
ncbi:Sodium/myo-inositol cotransporter [Nymphon striatum]|nr:Sodium/myo-inositol cotransporter [Nymphon striatum]